MTTHHLIGLLLGKEEDWPRAFETLLGRVGPIDHAGETHHVTSERLSIEPFRLTDPVRPELVIDRLAHWYYHPREWLKKAAMVNGTYLLNSPFTFQSMEKHSAYCALVRMGFKVPPTTLVPYKNPVDNVRWAYTSERYNRSFDLDGLAEELGYPLYMKPFDGGAWRGVSRIGDRADLHRAYDESGEMLMHLQATVDYEHFARALSIGPETMVMDFRPDQPMHQRYAVNHGFLSESAGRQAVAISRIVNAFFLWEFNSAEMLVVGDDVYPIDYANACPDVAVTSLHYYFPWAITALVRWSVFCVVTGRRADVDMQTKAYFEVADSDRSYDEKVEAYLELADQHFGTERYWEFCAEHLPHLEEQVLDWVTSDDFDRLLRDTVASTYPPHEQEQFLAHFRGLVGQWAGEQVDPPIRLRSDRVSWLAEVRRIAGLGRGAIVSHMEVGVRELRNDTSKVIDAVRAGERVTLTVRGEPVADIVPHGSRSRWLAGAAVGEALSQRAADPGLRADLDSLAGETLAEW